MASLSENRPLLISVGISASVLVLLASGIAPDLSATFEIVSFTSEVSYCFCVCTACDELVILIMFCLQFRNKLMLVLLADFVCSFVVDRLLSILMGYAKPRLPK